jgi:hypothetical protein
MASRLCLDQPLQVRQNPSEGAAHQFGGQFEISEVKKGVELALSTYILLITNDLD